MTREETKFCEECQNCKLIEEVCGNFYIHCSKRKYRFDDVVIYCKCKKLKKENKKKC